MFRRWGKTIAASTDRRKISLITSDAEKLPELGGEFRAGKVSRQAWNPFYEVQQYALSFRKDVFLCSAFNLLLCFLRAHVKIFMRHVSVARFAFRSISGYFGKAPMRSERFLGWLSYIASTYHSRTRRSCSTLDRALQVTTALQRVHQVFSDFRSLFENQNLRNTISNQWNNLFTWKNHT